jgi:hypothetical protein
MHIIARDGCKIVGEFSVPRVSCRAILPRLEEVEEGGPVVGEDVEGEASVAAVALKETEGKADLCVCV